MEERIRLNPELATRPRTQRKVIFTKKYIQTVSDEEFKNLLKGLAEEKDWKSLGITNINFLIKLKYSYFEDKQTIPRIENLNIKINQIIDSVTLLAYAKIGDLLELSRRNRNITKQLLCQLEWVGLIKPDEKLSDSILRLLGDVGADSRITVNVLIPRKTAISQVKEYMGSITKIVKDWSYSPFGNSFIVEANKKEVMDLAELPFVQSITTLTTPKGQEETVLAGAVKKLNLIASKNVSSICVLDTGVSKELGKFCSEKVSYIGGDYQDTDAESHGSSVAGVGIFGYNLTEIKGEEVVQSADVISVKIAKDKDSGPDRMGDVICKAIQDYKHKTRIFCTSFCYPSVYQDYQERRNIARSFDKTLFEENVILVNSCGNIFEEEQVSKKYEKDKLPILSPSDSHLVISVGSGIARKQKFNKSSICRFGRSSIFLYDEKRLPFKPDVFVNGGDCANNQEIFVLDRDNKVIKGAGTSFSAPLVANLLAQIQNKYGVCKTSELLKTMLFSKCTVFQEKNRITKLFIPSHTNPLDNNDAVYLDFEYVNIPKIEAPKKKGKKDVACLKIEVPIFEEINGIDLFVCHSTSESDLDPNRHISKVLVEACNPKGVKESRRLGNMNDFASLTYGRYGCSSKQNKGVWRFSFHLEANWLSPEQLDNLKSRLGVSFRLNVPKKHLDKIPALYKQLNEFYATKSIKETEEEKVTSLGEQKTVTEMPA